MRMLITAFMMLPMYIIASLLLYAFARMNWKPKKSRKECLWLVIPCMIASYVGMVVGCWFALGSLL